MQNWEELIETTKRKSNINVNEAHELLGHVGETILRHTWNKRSFTVIGPCYCEFCAINKKARQKPTSKERAISAENPNDLIYMDFIGPFKMTFGGNRHWLAFNDENGNKVWSSIMKTRSVIPSVARRFL